MSRPQATLFRYLAMRDEELHESDLIIGFGHFDPKIPRRCCELYTRGLAPRVLFTGGVGAGTADLGRCEADFFLAVATAQADHIPKSAFIVENRSTNTGENIRMSSAVLGALDPPLRFGREIRSVILVASAYRQRRAMLTARLHLEGVDIQNAPPLTDYAKERALFADKDQMLDELMVGEVTRIRTYPAEGFTLATEIPEQVLVAARRLADPSSDAAALH